jgi:hypothetical protein
MNDLYCACDKKKCKGECRKLHLHRRRPSFVEAEWDEICPAAYRKTKNDHK